MTQPRRRIDHVVVAVRNLEEAGAFYGRLGFQVGGRNRHPWGTENRLVQFGSSFIELITVGDDPGAIPAHTTDRFSFGAFVRDYLSEREGMAMLALDSLDAVADARAFAAAGLERSEPFHFERAGRRPDGGETRVAFSLAFASGRGARSSLFVCQQHFPENFWSPVFQTHPNGATAVGAVTLSAAAPDAQVSLLSTFTGSPAMPLPDGALFALQDGRFELARGNGGPELTSFSVSVPDVDAQAKRLRDAGVPFEAAGRRVSVRPRDAFGVEVVFVVGPDRPATDRASTTGMTP